jgi:predicted transposase YbfD/YdcC
VIAFDGKALRGSHELGKGMDHAVSAWAADAGVTLAQVFVDDKSNEITAIPKLLAQLDLRGHTVTSDAMGTQVPIAQQIVDAEADYILALKGNQGDSHKEVIDHFEISLRHLNLKKAIRQHWSIENQCHWVSETCFREDHNQTRKANAAKNLGTVRRIVLNILKEDPGIKGSLPAKRRRALMNRTYRERLLSLA